jgi:uncharacterized protein (TIGR03435 family)
MRCPVSLAAVAVCLLAQPLMRFEVAAVKLRQPGRLITMIGGAPSGSRLTLEAMSLSDLVSWAYNVKPWQVAGGPLWSGVQVDRTTLDSATRRFDISAKAEGDSARSPEEFRQMMQALLADRFQLTLHRESRDTPVYVLVTEKQGPKLSESPLDAKGILRMNGGGKIAGSGATMAQLASWFSKANGVERPVIDQTGLTGRYDFTLEWSNPLASAENSTAPSIFTAMPEQLGLKLEPRRAPVEFIVIVRAEMPSEN